MKLDKDGLWVDRKDKSPILKKKDASLENIQRCNQCGSHRMVKNGFDDRRGRYVQRLKCKECNKKQPLR